MKESYVDPAAEHNGTGTSTNPFNDLRYAMNSEFWSSLDRVEYLKMIDRHWPFWAALDEFIWENGVDSIVEAGCGLGQLCHRADWYFGVDINSSLLAANQDFHRRGMWLCADFLSIGVEVLADSDLFVASALIEHCESFQAFLKHTLKVPFRYAVITFHKGLREKELIQQNQNGLPIFENYYSRADVEAWLFANCKDEWSLFDLPFSRRERQAVRESVLIIDRTGCCKLGMWEKRQLNVEG